MHTPDVGTASATADRRDTVDAELEGLRTELTGYCYRMLASPFDAQDAAQEALSRAWRSADGFEGRSSVRTWVYRIATNVCLDMLRSRQRRARAMDLGPASTVATAQLSRLPPDRWVEPAPDHLVVADDDPEQQAIARESLRLALVAALQHLPPRQRAVLVLFEALRFSAAEIAQLLETSTASVNSALQRARATIAERAPQPGDVHDPLDDDQRDLLERYADAFERYDMDALVSLLHEDATQSMPPYELWLQGSSEIAGWMLGPGAECEGSRVVATCANGLPAFGQYRRAASGRGHDPWALQVAEIVDGRITGLHFHLDTEHLFPLFGLPLHLPEVAEASDEPAGSRR